ncbi:hypothetical protein FB451DRAFT_1229610 [Mycena latifolia]|nr:hypothetical protein FB451DRAFT_1229610 [Mycena latifolia]
MSKDSEYHPLMTDPADEDEGVPPPAKPAWPYLSRTVLAVVLAAETLTLAIALFLLSARAPTATSTSTLPLHSQHSLYSPALGAVDYEVKVFDDNIYGSFSPFYLPSSPALDEMWHDLYGNGISRLVKEEAARLPNKTRPIPGDESHYACSLLFHSLHCLLDPDHYPEWRISPNIWPPSKAETESTMHIFHCVDLIRQSLMCQGDTSMVVFQWDDGTKEYRLRADVAHTCRKFDKLQDWAEERVLDKIPDKTIHIEDDLVIPIVHSEMP